MGDGGLWIAGLTGATAVLASWVTSRGHTRAAQLQAEIAVAAQAEACRQEVRRAAYFAYLEQAHLMGVEYRQTPNILKIEDQEQRCVRLEEHRARLREVFGSFRHTCQVATVHALSTRAIDACHAVSEASRAVYMRLGDIAGGTRDPSAFYSTLDDYWRAVGELGEAVRLEEC